LLRGAGSHGRATQAHLLTIYRTGEDAQTHNMSVAIHLALQAAAAEARLLACLREAGAVSPRTATELLLESSFEEHALKGLLRTGVVVESGSGRYFVDEAMAAIRTYPQRQTSRRVLSLLLLLLAIIGVVVIAVLFQS
jgi:hypothetical protein